ncbi:uncharacterized protein LOC111317666 [Durio zibethinus]|uniref:Uncharacterized protein LOC111317666 n=1 Tax=Durio zibethinus TaxID=66656 RepID=A0A6P6BFF8_DURZI|nr:uncharacterized protein LOC111317666 [Durio zibethinus]
MKGIEIENHSNMLNQKPEIFNILKEALMIPYKTTHFIPLSFVASIPLLCFLVFHEMILQRILIATSEILRQPPAYFDEWLVPVNGRRMANDFFYKLIQLGLLHLLPLHQLELCAAVVTVDLTGKTYIKEKPMTPREMVKRLLNKARCKGILITSAYVYFVSTCFLLGSTWLVTNYYIIVRNFFYYVFTAALFRVAAVALLVKYLEWTAIWNMSIVISMLEEVHGANALGLSAYFCRGSERQGFLLMLVFFVWVVGLRLACFYSRCNLKGWRTILHVSLICMGNVMKWVVCVIYFYHRKKQTVDRVDEEAGRPVKAVYE